MDAGMSEEQPKAESDYIGQLGRFTDRPQPHDDTREFLPRISE